MSRKIVQPVREVIKKVEDPVLLWTHIYLLAAAAPLNLCVIYLQMQINFELKIF